MLARPSRLYTNDSDNTHTQSTKSVSLLRVRVRAPILLLLVVILLPQQRRQVVVQPQLFHRGKLDQPQRQPAAEARGRAEEPAVEQDGPDEQADGGGGVRQPVPEPLLLLLLVCIVASQSTIQIDDRPVEGIRHASRLPTHATPRTWPLLCRSRYARS